MHQPPSGPTCSAAFAIRCALHRQPPCGAAWPRPRSHSDLHCGATAADARRLQITAPSSGSRVWLGPCCGFFGGGDRWWSRTSTISQLGCVWHARYEDRRGAQCGHRRGDDGCHCGRDDVRSRAAARSSGFLAGSARRVDHPARSVSGQSSVRVTVRVCRLVRISWKGAASGESACARGRTGPTEGHPLPPSARARSGARCEQCRGWRGAGVAGISPLATTLLAGVVSLICVGGGSRVGLSLGWLVGGSWASLISGLVLLSVGATILAGAG